MRPSSVDNREMQRMFDLQTYSRMRRPGDAWIVIRGFLLNLDKEPSQAIEARKGDLIVVVSCKKEGACTILVGDRLLTDVVSFESFCNRISET